jgi:hypothetical protein
MLILVDKTLIPFGLGKIYIQFDVGFVGLVVGHQLIDVSRWNPQTKSISFLNGQILPLSFLGYHPIQLKFYNPNVYQIPPLVYEKVHLQLSEHKHQFVNKYQTLTLSEQLLKPQTMIFNYQHSFNPDKSNQFRIQEHMGGISFPLSNKIQQDATWRQTMAKL